MTPFTNQYFAGHTMYLENTYGGGYEQYDSLQKLQKVSKFEDENYFDRASNGLSKLFDKDVTPLDISEFINHQPSTFFTDEIKVTSGFGAFGRIY